MVNVWELLETEVAVVFYVFSLDCQAYYYCYVPQGDTLQQGRAQGTRLYWDCLYRLVDVQLFCTINHPHVKYLMDVVLSNDRKSPK